MSHAAAATAVAACLRKPFMHVTLVIAGGIVLLGLFLPTWLAVALVNLWVGVQHAGYGLREELPILLLVFLVPAALAGVAIWLAPR